MKKKKRKKIHKTGTRKTNRVDHRPTRVRLRNECEEQKEKKKREKKGEKEEGASIPLEIGWDLWKGSEVMRGIGFNKETRRDLY